MKCNKAVFTLILYILALNISYPLVIKVSDKGKIRNLYAFARLYGYIKYFHPSDEASSINWDKFAIWGSKEILNCKNNIELETNLKRIFLPLAPSVQIYSSEKKVKKQSIVFSRDTIGLNLITWQHYGVRLSDKSTIYKSKRVCTVAKIMDQNQLKVFTPQIDNSAQKIINSKRLFGKTPEKFESFKAKIGERLFCKIPLTLYCDSIGTLGKNKNYPFQLIKDRIDAIDLTNLKTDDLFVRLADVIIAWNVFQHFYPYFDIVKVDWNKVLIVTLEEAIKKQTREEFYITLRKMTAQLLDGHGFITDDQKQLLSGLPIRVDYIENNVIVTSSEDTLFKRGDIVKNIDGKNAIETLVNGEKIVPGSPQLKRYLALIEFGNGTMDSVGKVELIREEKTLLIKKEREPKENNYFQNRLLEFNYPSIRKIDNTTYYVNLLTIDEKEFADSLSQLAQANAIIFDFRWTAKRKSNYIPINQMILLMYLINSDVETAKWNVPAVIYPDRKKITFIENTASLKPLSPHFKSKNIFLVGPNVISWMETFMGIVEHYKLGEIVGTPTAGTNGNVNHIQLMGGFNIMFTGMKVLKQDGSQHHLIGIQPTYPLQRTIKAVKEGRDEYLEKAIEVLNAKIKN